MSVAEILHKPETLRKLLDERGVEHYDRFDVTEWVGSDGEICHTSAIYSNGATVLVLRKCTTPEQAIEATLGRGECKADETGTIKCWVKCKDEPSTEHMELIHVMECSACGGTYEHVNGSYEFCPRCGRKVVDA